MLTAAQKGSIPPTPSIHRLRCGLPGYLILFAPHTFAPQRQLSSRKPPSPLVFLLISTHFTATLGIPLSSPILKAVSFNRSPGVKPRYFTTDLTVRLRALLHPVNPDNACHLRITAAAGIVVSRDFLKVPSLSSSLATTVYNPKTFFLHAALLRQGCPHCAIFPHCCLP